jgi:WD40 repeat protein
LADTVSAVPPTLARPLLEILGARWRVGVSAAAVAWDMTTGLAGFALSDGTLALAHPVWDGAPVLRTGDGGRAELVPATAPAPPAARAKAHQAACLSVAADPEGGFLTGGADGRVTRVQADGTVRAIAHLDGPVSLVAAGPGHWRACAVRRSVHRLGAAAARVDVPGLVSALAIDPNGARLAAGYEGGITLWAGGDAPPVLEAPGLHGGVAWSSDRTFLASFTPDGILHAWRLSDTAPSRVGTGAKVETGAAVTNLGMLGAGFVAGAGGRVLYWHPPAPELLPCGVPNQAPVTRIAGHPCRELVAAGYANGTVVLCQPNSNALLFLRAAGEGAISALAFSPTGACLAIGTDGGEIGVVALPDTLFRDQARRP